MDCDIGYLTMQIAVLEEQKRITEDEAAETEAAENAENETQPSDDSAEPAAKSDGVREKPDINDVPMEENQVNCFLSFMFQISSFV